MFEEMRRAVATTRWIASQWETWAKVRNNMSEELADGLGTYAYEHAAL